MSDITPELPGDRPALQAYRPGGFRISGGDVTGGVLLFPDGWRSWPVTDPAALTPEDLAPVLNHVPRPELLLIGCGDVLAALPTAARRALEAAGLAWEPMDTGAAVRTFPMLLAEDRLVAAALIPVGGSGST